jgi:hypothetical protein
MNILALTFLTLLGFQYPDIIIFLEAWNWARSILKILRGTVPVIQAQVKNWYNYTYPSLPYFARVNNLLLKKPFYGSC